MAKPVQGQLADGVYIDWNEGYHDGYNGLPHNSVDRKNPETYQRAFLIGDLDRLEDEGQLNANGYDDRQDYIDVYGSEEKASQYRETP